MAAYNLLTLKLDSPISYSRLAVPTMDCTGFDPVARTLIPQEDGGETILVYESGSLVGNDGDQGPYVLTSPELPASCGVAVSRDSGARKGSQDTIVLASGLYAFLQWQAPDGASLAEGIEFFARETWWQRAKCAGPWILRRVAEDGKIATQMLARLAET